MIGYALLNNAVLGAFGEPATHVSAATEAETFISVVYDAPIEPTADRPTVARGFEAAQDHRFEMLTSVATDIAAATGDALIFRGRRYVVTQPPQADGLPDGMTTLIGAPE